MAALSSTRYRRPSPRASRTKPSGQAMTFIMSPTTCHRRISAVASNSAEKQIRAARGAKPISPTQTGAQTSIVIGKGRQSRIVVSRHRRQYHPQVDGRKQPGSFEVPERVGAVLPFNTNPNPNRKHPATDDQLREHEKTTDPCKAHSFCQHRWRIYRHGPPETAGARQRFPLSYLQVSFR